MQAVIISGHRNVQVADIERPTPGTGEVLPMVACGERYACRTGHSNRCESGIDCGQGSGVREDTRKAPASASGAKHPPRH